MRLTILTTLQQRLFFKKNKQPKTLTTPPTQYADFKADALRYLGEQKEKYDSTFDLRFDIKAFEDWAKREI